MQPWPRASSSPCPCGRQRRCLAEPPLDSPLLVTTLGMQLYAAVTADGRVSGLWSAHGLGAGGDLAPGSLCRTRRIWSGTVKMMKETAACLVVLVATACSPQVKEEPPDFSDAEVVRQACESMCATSHACCDPVSTESTVCSPMYGLTEEACVDECVGSDSEWNFNEECRDDFYTNIDCAAGLTCGEYVDYYKGTPGHVCEAEKNARFEMVNKGCFST